MIINHEIDDAAAIWRLVISQLEAKATSGQQAQTERYILIVLHLCQGGALSTKWLRDKFGVAKATAKRDMLKIEHLLPVVVTEEALHENSNSLSTVLRLAGRGAVS